MLYRLSILTLGALHRFTGTNLDFDREGLFHVRTGRTVIRFRRPLRELAEG